MFFHAWFVVGIIGGVLTTSILAAPFFPDRGVLFPDGLEGSDVGYVLSNPARFRDKKPMVKLETTPSFLGYQHRALAYYQPIGDFQIFAGHMAFGTSDLVSTVRNSVNSRPVVSGSFSHDYEQVLLGLGYTLPDFPIVTVAAVEWVGQTLAGSVVSGWGASVGVSGTYEAFWASVYLHRLLQPTWTWGSGYTERLATRPLIAVGYTADRGSVMVDTDGDFYRIHGGWWVSPERLRVFGDGVFSDTLAIARTGVGVVLLLPPFQFQYTRLFFSETTLAADHDIFAIGIVLDLY